MGFGGSAVAMIQSIRSNKNQLSKREGYFDKKNQSTSAYGDFKDHKKMSPAQFAAFQKKTREEAKRLQRKQYVILSITMSLLISGILYILFYA